MIRADNLEHSVLQEYELSVNPGCVAMTDTLMTVRRDCNSRVRLKLRDGPWACLVCRDSTLASDDKSTLSANARSRISRKS